jgi:hypothetical protein
MPNSTSLVATNRENAFRLPDKTDIVVSTAADVLPVAWLALFEPKQAVVPPRSKHVTLFSERDEALERFERRRENFRKFLPPVFEDDFDALVDALKAADAGYVQAFLHGAAFSWIEDERDRLQRYVRATDGTELREWRRALWGADIFLGESFEALEFAPDKVVNGLVGWITGRPAPAPKGEATNTEAEAAEHTTAAERKANEEKRHWEKFLLVATGRPSRTYRVYGPSEVFAEGEGLKHPKFGGGYVTRLLSATRIEAAFQHGKVTLVQGAT